MLAETIREHFSAPISDPDQAAQDAVDYVYSHAQIGPNLGSGPIEVPKAAQLIIGDLKHDAVYSIKVSNLARNFVPTLGALGGMTLKLAPFLAALMVCAARQVNRKDASILHIAHNTRGYVGNYLHEPVMIAQLYDEAKALAETYCLSNLNDESIKESLQNLHASGAIRMTNDGLAIILKEQLYLRAPKN